MSIVFCELLCRFGDNDASISRLETGSRYFRGLLLEHELPARDNNIKIAWDREDGAHLKRTEKCTKNNHHVHDLPIFPVLVYRDWILIGKLFLFYASFRYCVHFYVGRNSLNCLSLYDEVKWKRQRERK